MKRLLVAFPLLGALGCQATPPPPVPASAAPATIAPARANRLKGAYRFEKNGWIFVHIEGAPDQLGYQHGTLLSAEIADLLRVTKPFLQQTTGKDWAFYRDAAEKIMWPGIDEEYREELDGIVAGLAEAGVKADRWDIVALNAMEELPSYYVPWLNKKEGKPPGVHSPGNCSAFIATGAWTKDRKIVIGHNAWTNYVVGARWNIMFDIKPARGHRILMDGLPGIITSDDDFGVNDAGIVITETTITQFEGFNPAGTPEFYRARRAMQYAESIDDYVRIMLERNNGGYANDWLIGDNKTGEIALFEIGLKNWTVDKTKSGYFVGSNFPVKPKLTKEETTFNVADKANSPNARRARWEQLMVVHKGAINAEIGKAMEADKTDAFDGTEGPNERTLCGVVDTSPRGVKEWDWAPYFPGGTTQAKVMDSAMAGRLEMWAAMGHPCAPDFKAEAFLSKRSEYGWMRGLLNDMKTEPWTAFRTGMKAGQ